MSDVNDPIEQAQSWDTIQLGNVTSPGVCELSGFKRLFGWDVKKGKGTKGSTLTLNEYPPVEGSIKFMLWEVSHFEEWAQFRKLFQYDPTKKPVTALDIYHPSLADIELKSVVCKSISAIKHEGKQLYTCEVELIEYHPPPKKNASGNPAGSKTNAAKGPGTSSDPVADAQQAEIARLLAEAKKP